MDDFNDIEEKRNLHRIKEIYRINTFINYRNNFYHYSNYDNLDKIIHQDGYIFKMTDYQEFKDKLEGQIIIRLYRKVVKKLYRKKKIDCELCKFLLKIDLINKGIVKVSNNQYDYDKYHLFVTCFTDKVNDKYMWNNYCGKGLSKTKICIVIPSYLFNTQNMCIDNINEPKLYDAYYKFQKVIYDKNEQKELLRASVLKHIEFYKKDNSSDRLDFLKFNIIEDLNYYQLMFKSRKFKKENEFRIIYVLSDKKYIDYQEENDKHIFIKFLTNENKPVLFLNLNEECTNEFIKEINDNQINDYDN